MLVERRRIVSLVPSTTESVCVLGAGERLVGCTRYCTEPEPALRSVRRVGGTKNPDREAIVALAPDLVLANAEENRAEDLAWLAQRVPVVTRTPRTVAEAGEDLRALAEDLGRLEAAAPLLAALARAIDAAPAGAATRRPLRVYYAIWCRPWMSASRDTFVHDVLRLAGAHNVCADRPARYPVVEPSAAVAAGVEVVLLASEPWSFDEPQRLALARAATFGSARLVLCDGRDFCWHGARIVTGLPRAVALLRGLRRGT